MMMSRAVAVAVCAVMATSVLAIDPISWGFAAYTYGPFQCIPGQPCAPSPSCNEAAFAPDIAAFNQRVSEEARINMVLSYGGDVELWGTHGDPHACWAPANSACNASVFYDPQNAKAAAKYKDAFGVESIMALVDGRMDGWNMIETYNHYDPCDFGSFYPNLNNLTSDQIQKLAEDTATLYCADDNIRGVQVDLEPFKDPYTLSVTQYVTNLAAELRESDKCVSNLYPDGRSVSYFTFAHSQSHEFMTEALGSNGFAVFSVYDLDPKPADGGFMYNTAQEYAEKLRYELNFIPAVVQSEGRFSLAVPIAASCHEYEKYVPMHGEGCGPACIEETNNETMADYAAKTFEVLLSAEVQSAFGDLFCIDGASRSQFVGLSFWTWTHVLTYPPQKWFDNQFLPPTPSDAVLDEMAAHLDKFFKEDACTKPDCDSSDNRPNTCACDHSWQCTSEWCANGKCGQHPATWLNNPPESWRRQYGDPKSHPAAKAALEAEWK